MTTPKFELRRMSAVGTQQTNSRLAKNFRSKGLNRHYSGKSQLSSAERTKIWFTEKGR